MIFRRSKPDDSTAIAMAEEVIFPDPWTKKDITSCISVEGAMCFTAEEDGKPVAYILGRVIAPEGEIYRVAVLPEYRKRGIAYRLLDYAVKTERGRGLEVLFLEVRSRNLPAISLYRAYGFRQMGVRRRYYKSPDDDALIMAYGNQADLFPKD
jgi:ribosomal-protein-alanine N-acetyltransferase